VLKFRGHHFFGDSHCACCVADERVVAIDPTGTGSLRAAFNSTLAIKWRGLRVLVRRMIVDQDILSLGSRGLMAIANPAIQGGATRTQMFQRWFDYIAAAQVLEGDGSFIRDFIRRGYDAGRTFAQREVGLYSAPLAGDRQETIHQLAAVELQGIIEAVSQGAVRAVANGLLHGSRPTTIAREVNRVIDRVGIPRSTALVELLVVKAFSEASLDVYESAGVRRVGLVPETLLATRDARKVRPTGKAGTRSRKGEGPGIRTIQRIKKQEREIESAAGALVRVKTAGDKKVCKVCRGIARRGPYKINRARSLIPAHPRCRCVFVPVVTRFKRDEWNEADHPRDPETGEFTESGGGGGASDIDEALKKLDELESVPDNERHFDPSFGGEDYGEEVSVKSVGFERTRTPTVLREREKFVEKSVPLSDIIVHQPSATKGKVREYIKNPPKEPVDIVHKDGKYYAASGTHRLVAAKLRGEKTINARVYTRKK
jgi:hypothetical protein